MYERAPLGALSPLTDHIPTTIPRLTCHKTESLCAGDLYERWPVPGERRLKHMFAVGGCLFRHPVRFAGMIGAPSKAGLRLPTVHKRSSRPPFGKVVRQMFLLARVHPTGSSRSGGDQHLPSTGPSRLGGTIDPASCSRFPPTNVTFPILSLQNRRRERGRFRPNADSNG